MSLDAFLSDNVEKVKAKEVVVSSRFKKDGEIIPWKIRPITTEEDDKIREDVIKIDYNDDGGNKIQANELEYLSRVTAQHVVYPDLHNAQLQDSYGVKTPHDLLNAMLYSHERNILQKAINDLNKGLSFEALEDEAKNE